MTLFNRYKSSGMISEALLVGRNVFNKNPGNKEVFEAYFSYLCSLAETLPSIDDRNRFADQANVALAFFAENVIMSQEVVETIQSCQDRIDQIFNGIYENQQAQEDQEREKAKLHNNDCIKKLYALKDDLRATTTQAEFDAVLARIAQRIAPLLKMPLHLSRVMPMTI